MNSSLLSGFYRLSIDERIRALRKQGILGEDEADRLSGGVPLLPRQIADKMVENVVGVFGLPFAVAPNFLVNGKNYIVPMVVEEPSVVAAVSGAAKLIRESDGFRSVADDPLLTGQVQIVGVDDADKAVQSLYAARDELLTIANDLQPNLVARGGGARDIEYYKYRLPDGDWTVVLHLLVDTCDAMGANIVNTMCEGVAPRVEEICGGNVVLRILSNLADKALVKAEVSIALQSLASGDYSPEFVRDGIVLANDFANADPYRAATHNKGIMNGIDAVAIATGNDWRAIEAGAHAYAVRDGGYRSLTSWTVAPNGDLNGELLIPLKTGIVGGSLSTNPGARLGLAISGVGSARELSELMAATGLAQNFAALRALVSTGIQRGHMSLHARSVAATAGVPDGHFDAVVDQLIESGEIKTWKASAIAADLAGDEGPEGAATGEACGKVILLGEHAAVYGRHVVALPLSGAVRAAVSESAAGVTLSVPDWGIRDQWRAGDALPDGAAAIVALIMQEMGVGARGFDIRVSSRIPIGVGLGSSAAFAVAVIRAFDGLLDTRMSNRDIDALAFRCEELTHGTPSGIDNNLATYGEPILFARGNRGRTRPIRMDTPPPLVVASSGIRGSTRDMVAGVRSRFARDEALYTTIFDEIDEISMAGAAALREADYEHLGSLMNVCHGFLNAIGVSTPELENMISVARKAGAVGAKLTGAGGGGSIVALCPGKVDAVSAALAAAGYEIIEIETSQGKA